MTTSYLEFGSFYHDSKVKKADSPWAEASQQVLTGSGRDALYAILNTLQTIRVDKPIKVWIPSYYCHQITIELETRFTVQIYGSAPFSRNVVIARILDDSDIVVIPEYFGMRSEIKIQGSPIVLLDKTHNPIIDYQYDFEIAYVFGSLRKLLPITDGGFVTKKTANYPSIEPLELSLHHVSVTKTVKTAMSEKRSFLLSGIGDKKKYLSLFGEAEEKLGCVVKPSLPSYDLTALINADFDYYVRSRQINSKQIAKVFGLYKKVKIMTADTFMIVQFECHNIREQVKRALIKKCIYPSVLWPVHDKYMREVDIKLSETILVIPNDHRYDERLIDILIVRVKSIMDEVYAVN